MIDLGLGAVGFAACTGGLLYYFGAPYMLLTAAEAAVLGVVATGSLVAGTVTTAVVSYGLLTCGYAYGAKMLYNNESKPEDEGHKTDKIKD